MTDRELLELAAKAASMDVHWGSSWQKDMMFRTIDRLNSPLCANVEWNPLADDGDALLLAVKLGLIVDTHGMHTRVCLPYGDVAAVESHDSDPCAATRRAIVRAAAAIGEAMP